MPFNPNADNIISLETAAQLTAAYRSKFPDDTKGHAFTKVQMQNLLKQPNCDGFRIYYGLDEDGNKELVIVAVDRYGNDLYEGMLLDNSQPCPTVCSTDNPLNTNT